jgi:hypothetical protein
MGRVKKREIQESSQGVKQSKKIKKQFISD